MTQNITIITNGQKVLKQLSYKQLGNRYSGFVDAMPDPDNLLVNGGFEFNGLGWFIGAPYGTTVTWTTEQSSTGHQSLMMFFENKDINFYHTYQNVVVQPDRCYHLEANIRSQDLTGSVGLDVWDAERGYQYWYGGQTNTVKGTVGWAPVSLRFCTKSDIKNIQVRIRCYGGHGQAVNGTAWIDDISLKVLSLPTP